MQCHANKQNIKVIQTAKQNQRCFTIPKNRDVLLGFDCIHICFAWTHKTNKTAMLYNSKTKAVELLMVLFALLVLLICFMYLYIFSFV